MTETLTPEQKQTLLAAIPKIEQAGGPKWYPWCDLEKQTICGSGGITRDMKWVHCPPAVAAAVIAWAHSGELRVYSHRELHCTVNAPEPIWDLAGKIVGYEWYFGGSRRENKTQLAASVALIAAVAEGLGEG